MMMRLADRFSDTQERKANIKWVFQVLTPFSLGRPTMNQVFAHLGRGSRDPTQRGPISFYWPAARLDDLLRYLDILIECGEIRKLDYNYVAEAVSFDTRGQSKLHCQVQKGLRKLLSAAIQNLALDIDDPAMRIRLGNVQEDGTAQIIRPGSLNACPDISFTEDIPGPSPLPSLVCEIC